MTPSDLPVSAPDYLILIGTSAGGMSALTTLVEQLPATLPAAVLVVQHLGPDSHAEVLVQRLAKHAALTCHVAHDGQPLQNGHLYFAPADHHLLVKDGHALVTRGPHENNFRPAVDALFRSAAVAYGPNVVGVVLTGMLHDGTAGLEFVKRCGGWTVVQDPHEAEFASMPESALRQVEVDYTVQLHDLGRLLGRLVSVAPAGQFGLTGDVPDDLRLEAGIAERVVGTTPEVSRIGQLAPLTCPDCGGNLWRLDHGQVLRFRCHTGHAFSAEALLANSQRSLEETLWVALRMMEERRNLLTGMAQHSAATNITHKEERLEDIKAHINRLREFLLNGAAGGVAEATVAA